MRHHRPNQLLLFYYPQRVRPSMAPTGLIPFSQYLHHNHEEDHDNFAGADHLDLEFMYGRWESHHDVGERDRRLDAAVSGTGWPLVQQHRLVLDSASVVLMSHHLFHRGARRDDSLAERAANPRFMFRFMLYRTTDPAPPPPAPPPAAPDTAASHAAWCGRIDAMTGVSLRQTPRDCTIIWEDIRAWLKGQAPPLLRPVSAEAVAALGEKLTMMGEEAGEHTRLASPLFRC